MSQAELDHKIKDIIEKDPRYSPEAYLFIMDSLQITKNQLNRMGHLTGEELCHGAKRFGHYLFGLMTKRIFASWGIFRTDDIGEIVFNLIESNLFGKSDEDDVGDFHDVFDFQQELVDNYVFRFGD